MKRILSIDLEKMTDESLKKRKLRLEKKIKEIEELFSEKVDSVYNPKYSWREDNPKEPRIIFVNRKNGRRLVKHDYYANLRDNVLTDCRYEMRDIERIFRVRTAERVKDYVIAYIVQDKKSDPSIYPDWLSFKVDGVSEYLGTIEITPHIDLRLMLSVKGDVRLVSKSQNSITTFWSRYFNNISRLDFKRINYIGIDNYIKNIFRKEIKNKINSELDPKGCVHSIIFKQSKSSYRSRDLIQIEPRFKKFDYWSTDEKSQYCRREFSQYGFKGKLKTLLKEYGWIEGVNYTNHFQRD